MITKNVRDDFPILQKKIRTIENAYIIGETYFSIFILSQLPTLNSRH